MHVDLFDLTQPMVWTVAQALTEDECAKLVQNVQGADWLPATVNSAQGRVRRDEVRSNTTSILEDADLAEILLMRVRSTLPTTMKGKKLARIGAKFRVYRYEAGQKFGLHHDQSYQSPDGLESHLTLIVYLNSAYAGGETDFPDLAQRIIPTTGTALFFQHALLHEGCEVTSGTKYILRSDVFYSDREAGDCS